jgi:hypothetical protein
MPKHNVDLMVVLSNQITACSALKQIDQKFSLNLFNVFTPSMITALDSEISANPYLLSEAMSLLEVTNQLSAFYVQDSSSNFITDMRQSLSAARLTWSKRVGNDGSSASIHKELMEEYFVSGESDFNLFLDNNPVYLGIYLYVYVRIVAMI